MFGDATADHDRDDAPDDQNESDRQSVSSFVGTPSLLTALDLEAKVLVVGDGPKSQLSLVAQVPNAGNSGTA